MKWLSANSTLLQCIALLAMIKYYGHYVDGAGGYQTDQSTMKGIDNGDNFGLANYRFEYGVDDGSAGQQFGHEEERNGHLTRGKYTVLLPDGRLQVVTYRADENGYKADVTYESGSAASAGNNGRSSGGYGYENVETSASSYGSPPPTKQGYAKGNSETSAFQGGGGNGKGNSKSFVKLRRTVDGRMFNYMY